MRFTDPDGHEWDASTYTLTYGDRHVVMHVANYDEQEMVGAFGRAVLEEGADGGADFG